MRSNSRHIRLALYQKDDYIKIINDGKIALQGQIFEVEEYLPPPKILICFKYNKPGHVKKTCESPVELCRRCGENRNDGNKHSECSIKCRHCDGDHIATDCKCPLILKFRQELLNRLKTDRNKLPPNIKLFIPVDCRTTGDRNRYFTPVNNNEIQNLVPSQPPIMNPWFDKQCTNNETSSTTDAGQTVKGLANELQECKKKFEIEYVKIKSSYDTLMKSTQQAWLMLQ